jgi:hypothetical protein
MSRVDARFGLVYNSPRYAGYRALLGGSLSGYFRFISPDVDSNQFAPRQ